MSDDWSAPVDLRFAKELAAQLALEWGLELGEPFAMNNVSFVAPTTDGRVLKVAWEGGEEESLHEPDALELWDGHGAVRAYRRSGHAVLEERAVPGHDLSIEDEDDRHGHRGRTGATSCGVRRKSPFARSSPTLTSGWDTENERETSSSASLVNFSRRSACTPQWVVHGDFHHHNILRHG